MLKVLRRRWIPITLAVIGCAIGLLLTGYFWPVKTSPSPTPPTSGSVATMRPLDTTPLLAGAATAGGGGSDIGPGGMPMGYPHTPDGAASMAASCAIWVYEPTVDTAEGRAALADACSTPAHHARRLSSIEFGARVHKIYGPNVRAQAGRGAYAVSSINDDQATVYLWTPVYYPGTTSLGIDYSLWGVTTFSMVWSPQGWKIDEPSQQALDLYVEGPVPADPWGNPSAAEKAAQLRDPARWVVRTKDQVLTPDAYVTATWKEFANATR